jgi:hypothetical protein
LYTHPTRIKIKDGKVFVLLYEFLTSALMEMSGQLQALTALSSVSIKGAGETKTWYEPAETKILSLQGNQHHSSNPPLGHYTD